MGIKHDFPFINMRKVPREVLKTEGEHLPRDLANVILCLDDTGFDSVLFAPQ